MKIDKEYIKFTYYLESPETKVETTIDVHSSLSEVLEKFQDFLKGCGYVFEGDLTIIEDNI
jgi:hypothetical protein